MFLSSKDRELTVTYCRGNLQISGCDAEDQPAYEQAVAGAGSGN